jgi:hypothetical protein
MLGIDFIGPFTPVAIDGSVYIIIAVDYFTRHLWTQTTKKADGPTVVSFLKSEIEKSHGFPKVFIQIMLPISVKANSKKI